MNIIDIQPAISIIILKVNGLNAPIKTQRFSECIKKKKDPTLCCLPEAHFKYKDTYRLKVNGEKYTMLTLIKTKQE